jgi:hypothetical protein
MTTTSTETEKTRQFREGIEAISKAPDGARKLRFLESVLTGPQPIPRMTDEEVWAKYEEFCKKEAAWTHTA